MNSLEWAQHDEMLAKTVAQFADACSAIRDEDAEHMKPEVRDILEGVIRDAAASFSFCKTQRAAC